MHIAWIGTRAPWPARDGGRLAASSTIEALAGADARVTVIAPGGVTSGAPATVTLSLATERRPGWAAAARVGLVRQLPLTIARHAMPAAAERLAQLIADDPPDVVHAEQLHALLAARQAQAAGIPLVLRAHNVEHALWLDGAGRAGATRWVVRAEGRRLRQYEARAVSTCDAIVALTAEDQAALLECAPAARVCLVPPAFPASVEAGPPLEGSPAIVWIGSAGWHPNDEARALLIGNVWPAITRRNQAARLHVFGSGPRPVADRVLWHDPPVESRAALARNAILVLPLRRSAGIRMRVLEAWAAGVPVVGTPAALRGLPIEANRHAIVARTAAEFGEAVAALHADPDLRQRVTAGGRALLAARHDPGQVARALLDVYRTATTFRMRR